MRQPLRRRSLLAALAAGACMAVAPAAQGAPGAADGVIMAQVEPGSSAAVAARTGLARTADMPAIGWATYATGGRDAAAAAALLGDPAVFRIDRMTAGERLQTDFFPRDSIWLQQGTVGLNGQAVASWNWHWVKTNFPAAWDITRGSSAVKVVDIDSEFDTEHPDLKSKLATGRNFDSGSPEFGTSNVRAQPGDVLHGSHTAGLIGAATDNGFGVSGACFDCVVIPYKIGFGGDEGQSNVDAKFISDLTTALMAAGDSDGVVISMSLGTSRDHPPLRAAVDYARAHGKIVVASAGNSQLGTQGPAGVPNYPAAYPGVIAVGATRPDDTIAPFSTNGDYVDVSAPGDPVLSTWDSRVPPGDSPDAPTHGQGYKAESGTSMAAPIVAGLAALMKTVRPDLSADEVEQLMKLTAVDLGAQGQDPVYGAGRIDAFAAVRAAQAYVRPAPPAPHRTSARIVWGCVAGRTALPAGRRAFTAVTRGQTLVCRGRTVPALRRVTLQVQRFARGHWVRVGLRRTDARGRFGFTRRLDRLGGQRIRVLYPGSATVTKVAGASVRAVAVRRTR
jgi:subtilisin family serine protease